LAEFWFVMRGATSQMERKEVQEMTRKLVETIAANDIDQHQTQMPDITDRLSEFLRTVPVSPLDQAAVFLCFKVILL